MNRLFFYNNISRPAVFVEFSQEEYVFSITEVNTSSEVIVTLDTQGGVPVEQITVEVPAIIMDRKFLRQLIPKHLLSLIWEEQPLSL